MKLAKEFFVRALSFIFLLALGLPCAPAPGHAQGELRGHGGPVRALSISAEGRHAITGSFDSTAINWSLERGQKPFHFGQPPEIRRAFEDAMGLR
jgi:WD40 repeat protein